MSKYDYDAYTYKPPATKKSPKGDMIMLKRLCPNCLSKLWYETILKRMYSRQEMMCIQCGWYSNERTYYDSKEIPTSEGYYSLGMINAKRWAHGWGHILKRMRSGYTCKIKSERLMRTLKGFSERKYKILQASKDNKLWYGGASKDTSLWSNEL